MERSAATEDKGLTPERSCRICYGGADDGPLLAPCRCKGSMRWVHESCLNSWRLKSEGRSAYTRCEHCDFLYVGRRSVDAVHVVYRCVLALLSVAVVLVGAMVASVILPARACTTTAAQPMRHWSEDNIPFLGQDFLRRINRLEWVEREGSTTAAMRRSRAASGKSENLCDVIEWEFLPALVYGWVKLSQTSFVLYTVFLPLCVRSVSRAMEVFADQTLSALSQALGIQVRSKHAAGRERRLGSPRQNFETGHPLAASAEHEPSRLDQVHTGMATCVLQLRRPCLCPDPNSALPLFPTKSIRA